MYDKNKKRIEVIDESKGIDPSGIVDTALGCKWGFTEYQEKYSYSISGQPIDFDGNGIISNDVVIPFYIDGSINSNIIQKTINEWDNLIYKPEVNSYTVVTSTFGDIDNNDDEPDPSIKMEPPHKNILMLHTLDIENYCDFENEVIVYNTKDNKYYLKLKVRNYSYNSAVVNIECESEIIENNKKSINVELIGHAEEIDGLTYIYIPLLNNAYNSNTTYKIKLKLMLSNGEEIIEEGDYSYWNEKISRELNQNDLTVIYSIRDIWLIDVVKEYELPFKSYKNNNGIWTNDELKNIGKYINIVLNHNKYIENDVENNLESFDESNVMLETLEHSEVYFENSINDVSTKKNNNTIIYLFIAFIIILLFIIIIFIKKYKKNNNDEYYE